MPRTNRRIREFLSVLLGTVRNYLNFAVRMEPCIIRSIGMVNIRNRKFSRFWRFSSDYFVFANSRCVNRNIFNNGGEKGRKGEGGKKGQWEEGEVWAREEVKVTGGGIIAKVTNSTGAPLTFKSCVSFVPATVRFWSF